MSSNSSQQTYKSGTYIWGILHPEKLILALFKEIEISDDKFFLKGRNVAVAINKTILGLCVIHDEGHIGRRVKNRVVKEHPVPFRYF